ncbi:MAG: type I DNA topoisomerase [Elusimicrobiota bacterium]|jgi:DNA topoisomerase-1|nr:type I DNA topoisomerase [Elusimicrobiota bacterium]
MTEKKINSVDKPENKTESNATAKTNKTAGGKSLIIVESPTKQKTISKILGPQYIVRSSFGHVRDLPAREIGVDERHDFAPTYVPSGKPKIIAELKDAVKKADTIYLATDPDREGEAIAWHLQELLKLKPERTRRIYFHEITPSAVKESFDHARGIDHNLVDAQQARRVLDRLVGYKLSPLLWRKITSGLSAGRVQSVAVRLLTERAKEIADFKEETYWSIKARLEKPGTPPPFAARILKWEGKNAEQTTTYKLFAEDYKVKTTVFRSNESLAPVNAALRGGPLKVEKIEKKEVRQKPRPPFITSSMQQDAYNKIGFSSQKTMLTAQGLYEGIEIGGETVGLITYMRTDSFNVSRQLQAQTQKYINEKYGQQFAPVAAPVYKSKVKGAQEAHESIHPTDVYRTPQSLKNYLTGDQYKLYELIWLRFVASQMADAVFNTVSVDISAGGADKCLLRANGRTVKFSGYLSVYKEEDDETDSKDKDETGESSALLPQLSEGDELKLLGVETKDHKTAPPPNYNEASLIKTLEKHGIGRPSTYAPTIKTIIDRKYAQKQPKTNKLLATELGITVAEHLKQFFRDIMDLSYTAGVEEKLDDIAEGAQKWTGVIRDFYTGFTKDLDNASQNMNRPEPKIADGEKCPLCGGQMLLRRSRYGEYLACARYPECKGKKNLSGTGAEPPQPTSEKCEKCGSPMVIRSGRRGKFMACSAYPSCRNTFSIDAEGKKTAATRIDSGRKCPNCGKVLLLRSSARGEFLGCSGFPKCKTIVKVSPEEIAEIKKAAVAN